MAASASQYSADEDPPPLSTSSPSLSAEKAKIKDKAAVWVILVCNGLFILSMCPAFPLWWLETRLGKSVVSYLAYLLSQGKASQFFLPWAPSPGSSSGFACQSCSPALMWDRPEKEPWESCQEPPHTAQGWHPSPHPWSHSCGHCCVTAWSLSGNRESFGNPSEKPFKILGLHP